MDENKILLLELFFLPRIMSREPGKAEVVLVGHSARIHRDGILFLHTCPDTGEKEALKDSLQRLPSGKAWHILSPKQGNSAPVLRHLMYLKSSSVSAGHQGPWGSQVSFGLRFTLALFSSFKDKPSDCL